RRPVQSPSVDAWRFPSHTVARLSYAEVTVDRDVLSLDPAPGDEPTWWDNGRPRIGLAALVITGGEERIVIDPVMAADDFIRTQSTAVEHQDRFIAAMSDAGCPVDTVDRVVLTHYEGVGMAARYDGDGSWSPLFPEARVLINDAEVEH